MAEQSAGELVRRFRDRELSPEELVAAMVQQRQEGAPVESPEVQQAREVLWKLKRYL